ncbi:ABC transporter substrate-binding protein [Kribbella sp. NPDC055110]
MRRPRLAAGIAIVVAATLTLAGCSGSEKNASGPVTLTFRTWDTGAAAAYEQSFAAFHEKNPDITVKVNVVPWANYFTKLRTDIAGSSADDVYWLNAQNLSNYPEAGKLVNVNDLYGADADATKKTWAKSVVDQYTRNGTLWGVPQLSDGGIGVFYNKKLLADAGLTEADIKQLTWNPTGGTLLSVAQKLTKDSAGKTADQPGFNADKITQYGYNAAQDLQAIYINYIGSNGGTYQNSDGTFTLTNPKTVEAFQYVVDLINKYHVAPSAADTNTNGNFALDAFTQGKEALFQSGLYNLQNVSKAKFDWGVVNLPKGPAGSISVTNGIVAVGNAQSKHLDATKKLLEWLGTAEGNSAIGKTGANLPAVLAAQQSYFDYWKSKGVDVTPFFDVVKNNPIIPAPVGEKYGAASTAAQPTLNEVFLGRLPVAEGLQKANDAANAALH